MYTSMQQWLNRVQLYPSVFHFHIINHYFLLFEFVDFFILSLDLFESIVYQSWLIPNTEGDSVPLLPEESKKRRLTDI